jgi:hypothetical protein
MRLLIALCRGVHPQYRWNGQAAWSPLPDLFDVRRRTQRRLGKVMLIVSLSAMTGG